LVAAGCVSAARAVVSAAAGFGEALLLASRACGLRDFGVGAGNGEGD